MHLSVDIAEIVDVAMGLALMFTGGQFVISDCFERRVHIINYVFYHTEVNARRPLIQLCIQITTLKC